MNPSQQAKALIDQLQDLTAKPWRWQAWTFFVTAPLSSALWWTFALVDFGGANGIPSKSGVVMFAHALAVSFVAVFTLIHCLDYGWRQK
jgi:hypothetical protein